MQSGKTVTVLGSTGSVGQSTVSLLLEHPGRWDVAALAAGSDAVKLAEQARLLNARFAAIADTSQAKVLEEALAGTGIEVGAGADAVIEAGARPAEWVMAAIGGAAGLAPTARALERGATVALANKESMVCAGALLNRVAARSGASIIPVDSEHSAIFQVFDSQRPERVRAVVLTASGGPFLDRSPESLSSVTPEDAVAHPVWNMGAKISVDSATMMNKGLELIEAAHLFPVRPDQLDVLIHPQSLVHGLVEYVDGTLCAVLGIPDMRVPIACALAWPDRMELELPRLDLADQGCLTFRKPDPKRFPALRIAREALQQGGSAPTILNAANEEAVAAFLHGSLPFPRITAVSEEVLATLPDTPIDDFTAVVAVDARARASARALASVH
ncbi:MAG: 1-deoxy-D-xylulose-5-phosphate reductoisomerase [Rhodospirillales bacterium]|nr:1-deoxy-D-xylulose-5-phosphate reductoisomerase [Rhodospirillales bacterium]MCY4002790.1 1-deoxy-D-xylulose-5-phosphate reductoisomerase [Rhodospirillales bacterium]MDE0371780.1 1-deoxy-D-xylulose-5-phosphate reductoisomerase [Rhodospirillales bacterium]MXX21914.1 1-deoxy-D-xylulose-5-phosphate reductoisomerase [Rhodospirillales bacterium]MYE20082.1 1-deoxy-D-xylulose-5-phosphate reductoisomerase [Rhodospirillales bacterium]